MIGQWTIDDVIKAVDATLIGDINVLTNLSGVSTDTRQIKPGDLFVCLRGDHFDAHDFVDQALEKGALAAITEKEVNSPLPQLKVKDALIALGRLATLNRNRFNGKVVAITGSSGKTTVKELLASMLKQQGPTLFTQGNLNNHIGAPLTLLQLKEDHQYAVIELGASAEGEIDYTVHLTQPHVALLNNACEAHIEGFGSLEGVVRAKSEIFNTLTSEGVAIINQDDPHVDYWREKLENMQRHFLSFSTHHQGADVWISDAKENHAGAWRFKLHALGQSVPIQLNLIGQHNIANAAAAATAWIALDLPLAMAKAGLEACQAVKGRMKPIQLKSGWLIDDSYNANPQAMKAAITFLAGRPHKRILVLGDMAELGADAQAIHTEIGNYAAHAGIDMLLATGPLMHHAVEKASQLGLTSYHFDTQKNLINELKKHLFDPHTILVKGSRSAQMDRVVDALQQEEAL